MFTDHPRPCYFAGGFVGGRTDEFLQMSAEISEAIDDDDQNDVGKIYLPSWIMMVKQVVAIWHDESHLNRYLSNHQHLVRILSPSYLYPD
eukprot:617533-Hanusia_phi.AAC.1